MSSKDRQSGGMMIKYPFFKLRGVDDECRITELFREIR